jgi:hypothetical protein
LTEAEWNVCNDPRVMLEFLRDNAKGSDRKLRLFGCACCRRIWHLLCDERSRRAVEIAELLADGLVTEAAAEAAGDAAAEVAGEDIQGVAEVVGWRAARAADHLLPMPEDSWQLSEAWQYVATALEGQQLVDDGADAQMLDAWSEQSVESGRTMGWSAIEPDAIVAGVLRETIGPLPFHPVAICPEVLAWNDGTVRRLAGGIYEERAFDRMPILADALLDAGCADEELVQHCREQGRVHVRGCWVIDLLTGRE